MESDGFWLYLVAQMAAAGPFAETLGLANHRRIALIAGLCFSLVAAFFALVLSYGGIGNEGARGVIRWLILLPMAASLLATGAAMVMPKTLGKK